MLENDLDLVRKIVWGHVKKNPGLEFDDLFSEACLAYLETEKHYDSRRGARSTFLWHTINNHLITFLKQAGRLHLAETTTAEINDDYYDDYSVWQYELSPEQGLIAQENLHELYAVLTPEAMAVCAVILKQTALYLPTDKPKLCRGEIVRTLRERDWSWELIWDTFRFLKNVFSVPR